MKSKDQIRSEYSALAKNRGLTGDSVELILDLLTYQSYENQIVSVANQFNNSLDRSSGNATIQQCVDRLYSVYRGNCPSINLSFTSNKILSVDKYGELYSSNSFKVFTTSQISITPTTKTQKIRAIISKERVYQLKSITDVNTFYIDILENDLSEDCLVKVNGVINTTTRIFSDHSRFDYIFTLTLPGYGIRLIKKSGFKVNDVIEFVGFRSTTLSSINVSELGKIIIQGTIQVTPPIVYSELPADVSKSLLQKANESQRTDSIIKSSSDVSYIFNEVFINKILDSITIFNKSSTDSKVSNKINIYYVPVPGFPEIDPVEAADYVTKYQSYYVADSINISAAKEIIVRATIKLVTNQPLSSYESLYNIFNSYENKLNVEVQENKVLAQLNKLSEIDHVESLSLDTVVDGSLAGKYTRNKTDYIRFEYDITYLVDDSINH